VPTLSRPRLEVKLKHLAVPLVGIPQRVIRCPRDRTVGASLQLQPLHMALKLRGQASGLVHHSGRAVQNANRDYFQPLGSQSWNQRAAYS
jgi:hypothetical protein